MMCENVNGRWTTGTKPFYTVYVWKKCYGTREDKKACGDAEATTREGGGKPPFKNALCQL